jgi:nucleotide-binding universal stress UspA family protein
MYRKILVPLDGSSFSESILDHAKAVISNCSVAPELVLLTVVEPFPSKSLRAGDSWVDKIQKEAIRVAANYLNQLVEKLHSEGIKAEGVVIEGGPAQAILDYAEKNNIDLIIMSTHGRSGISRWVFGSVATRILHHSPVPVLVARPPGQKQP